MQIKLQKNAIKNKILYKMLKIKEIRELKNLTQDDVVSLCGVKKRSYVDYENGKTDIPLSKLQDIAIALKVPIEMLIYGNEPKVIKENVTVDILINNLVDKKLSNVLKSIDALENRMNILFKSFKLLDDRHNESQSDEIGRSFDENKAI